MAKPIPRLSPAEIAAVIATAWDDRPPFLVVLRVHGLTEGQVVQLLKRELTPSAYKTWLARARSAPQPGSRSAPRPGSRSAPRRGPQGIR